MQAVEEKDRVAPERHVADAAANWSTDDVHILSEADTSTTIDRDDVAA